MPNVKSIAALYHLLRHLVKLRNISKYCKNTIVTFFSWELSKNCKVSSFVNILTNFLLVLLLFSSKIPDRLWMLSLRPQPILLQLVLYLPFSSVGWFIILVFTTSAGVPIVAATNPAQALRAIKTNLIDLKYLIEKFINKDNFSPWQYMSDMVVRQTRVSQY